MFFDTAPAGHTFFELTEQARARALQEVAQAHHTTRDTGEPEQLATALTSALAAAFGHPGTSPLGLEVTVWDGHHTGRWSLAGTLNPATAPALPWAPGIHTVRITWHRRIHIHTDTCCATADVQRMRTAVQATIASAWHTAHHQVATRQALERVAAYGPRFTAAGTLTNHPGPTEP